MELIAKLKTVHEIIERGNFKSRKIWVTTDWDSKYPQTIEVEVAQDKCGLFDNVTPSSECKLYLNLRGREWTKPETGVTSVFNTLSVWKVEVLTRVEQAATPAEKAVAKAIIDEDDKNDLPF